MLREGHKDWKKISQRVDYFRSFFMKGCRDFGQVSQVLGRQALNEFQKFFSIANLLLLKLLRKKNYAQNLAIFQILSVFLQKWA